MFKLTALILVAIIAVAAAYPSHLTASPVVYSSPVVQPLLKTHYAAVPVVKTVATPLLQTVASPLVHTVASPVVHGLTAPVATALVQPGYYPYGALSLAKNYASAYEPLKKTA